MGTKPGSSRRPVSDLPVMSTAEPPPPTLVFVFFLMRMVYESMLHNEYARKSPGIFAPVLLFLFSKLGFVVSSVKLAI